jgi:hypothetical protein
MKKGDNGQHNKRTSVLSKQLSTYLVGSLGILVIVITSCTYFHSRHRYIKRTEPEGGGYLICGRAQETRESAIHNEKCHTCLPNYFIRANRSDQLRYRRGTVNFLHHLKSGGTTIYSCLRRLTSRPYTWNDKTERRIPTHIFIQYLSPQKRDSMKKQILGSYHFIAGIAVMGLCDDLKSLPSCSYFTVLRDPINRVISSYFYCKVRPTDILCATKQLNAREAGIVQWAIHQRSFLFTQLTLDYRLCKEPSSKPLQSAPCWYRQRAVQEQTDLECTLQSVLEDLADRFAVIGILDYLQESLSMLEKVYGLKFTSCATLKVNNIQSVLRDARQHNSIANELKSQLTERDKMVAELRNNLDVMKAMR